MIADQDSLVLLAALLAHPRGQDIASLADKLHQDAQSQTQLKRQLVAKALNIAEHHSIKDKPSKRQLVAIALNLAKRQGIKDKPYFKSMTNDEIRRWIAKHSPKQEIS